MFGRSFGYVDGYVDHGYEGLFELCERIFPDSLVGTYGESCLVTNDGLVDIKWTESESYCVEIGGHLSSIHSNKENLAVHSFGVEAKSTFGQIRLIEFIQIGLFSIPSCNWKECYRWIDNSTVNYTNWNDHEPNIDAEYYTVMLINNTHGGIEKKWGDVYDYSETGTTVGICQVWLGIPGCWNLQNMKICSGHGECFGNCTCLSEEYFGTVCEQHYCYGYLNNDSLACSGMGVCIGHQNCSCSQNYTLDDCSSWKCFGKWHNDSREEVCNGFGNCTFPDICSCEHGYNTSRNCDWSCFGKDRRNFDGTTCYGFGNCIAPDVCNCTTTDYTGKNCDEYACFGVSSLETSVVCGGHGNCISSDNCKCDPGYTTLVTSCDNWNCFGVHKNIRSSVCSSLGECVGADSCSCNFEYEGDNCETWSCGFPKGNPSACSGNGICSSPGNCECNFGFKGDLCQTNTLYGYVMAPVLSLVGVIVICFCINLLCCTCMASILLLTCLIGTGITSYVVNSRQKSRLQRFYRLDHFEMILQEQLLEKDETIAHVRVRKELFEIKYDDVKIERMIGRGGSEAIVFLGTWENNQIAFKCFKTRKLCSHQDLFNDFEKEVELMASLNHPSIIRFYGACLKPPRVGIVMEYCCHGEILDFIITYREINNKAYPIGEKIRMLFEIASGVEYIHSKYIVHRDLKTGNVLVDSSEKCKLMDFGVSRILEKDCTEVTKRIGTSVYMAPEVVISQTYDTKCDSFSFAILAHVILSENENPYGTSSQENIEYRVMNDPTFRPNIEDIGFSFRKNNENKYGPDNKVSLLGDNNYDDILEKWMKNLIVRCWDADPNRRYSSEE